MKVRDRTGQTWRITRRWVPWRRRIKGAWELVPDWMPSVSADGAVGLILLVLTIVVLLPFLLVITAAAVELLVLLLVFPFALLGRVLFGRHWTIEARRGFEIWWQQEVGDWQASGVRIHEVADAIRRGEIPENNVAAPEDPDEPQEPEQADPPR